MKFIFKQGFKFLDPLCFFGKNKIMLLRRECDKIDGAIIMLNTIKMMDYPFVRKLLVVCFLPNNDVFGYILSFISSWVVRLIKINIFSYSHPATFPVIPFPQLGTRAALDSPLSVYKFTTINARFFVSLATTWLGYILIIFPVIFSFVSHSINYTANICESQAQGTNFLNIQQSEEVT